MIVNEKHLESWRVRRTALEELLFVGHWSSRYGTCTPANVKTEHAKPCSVDFLPAV